MAIGERIRFFRNLRGMTQKYLGQVVGFPEKTADIRMAQYESGSRTPKAELTESLADALGVSPLALSVPDIDSYLGLMHTMFTLEDRYGLTVETGENGVFLRVDPGRGRTLPSYPKCSLRGRNKRKSIVAAKSTGRTTTSGVITTRNMMQRPAMGKFRHSSPAMRWSRHSKTPERLNSERYLKF